MVSFPITEKQQMKIKSLDRKNPNLRRYPIICVMCIPCIIYDMKCKLCYFQLYVLYVYLYSQSFINKSSDFTENTKRKLACRFKVYTGEMNLYLNILKNQLLHIELIRNNRPVIFLSTGYTQL